MQNRFGQYDAIYLSGLVSDQTRRDVRQQITLGSVATTRQEHGLISNVVLELRVRLNEIVEKRGSEVGRLRAANILFSALIASPVLVSCPCAAQLEGGFSLSKPTYLAGEPVFLIFKVKNVGEVPVRIRTADPHSFCSNYHFEIKDVPDRWALPCGGEGRGGSCISGAEILPPGRSHTDRILLNVPYDLRRPGTYSLHATYRLKYGPAEENLSTLEQSATFQDFQSQEQLVIEPSQSDELQSGFAEYLQELDSADAHTKIEAAKVIGYLAPRFLEPTILKMLDTPLLQGFAVEGLRNLGTPSAHQALADFVKNSPPTNVVGPYQDALLYLGEIGDAGDVPILLAAARANTPDSFSRMLAIHSAGMAGGATAVQALETELSDPSIDTKQAAVRALYMTGSRTAVPVLIGLLRSREWRVSLTAEYGLEVLTHRSGAKRDSMNPPPPDTYLKWMRWWNTDGQTATIYKTDQCGETLPL